jgi:hypothetical protein
MNLIWRKSLRERQRKPHFLHVDSSKIMEVDEVKREKKMVDKQSISSPIKRVLNLQKL